MSEKEEKTYRINEVFYSIQGEGVRAGTAAVFVRFSKCNLACSMEPGPKSPGGFDCDTEFESGRRITRKELLAEILAAIGGAPWERPWVILTGGEPALQVDLELCTFLHAHGIRIAIETNGSIELPRFIPSVADSDPTAGLAFELAGYPFDWITVSPKVAEHAIRQRHAHEVKYVRGVGQAIPETRVAALHYLISPAFDGDALGLQTLNHCAELVRQNPEWRLSVQNHKGWRVR